MSEHDSDPAAPPLDSLGSYRLLEPLGSGGMSSVFRAVHIHSGHVVALKVLPRNLARSSTLLQRFLREAKSAEALEHPNIVAIYDRGLGSDRHYLVLEYVDGGDLHDIVHEHGPLAPEEAVRIIRAVAGALRYAAAQGVIHRDIKPANLLRARDGTVKIIDLGLALQVAEEDERVTRDGTTVGTVDYMAPEQARDSRATGVRSDIYSLGCTFYFLLTGMPPYSGGDIADKLRRHATTPPPDARQARAEVPEDVSRLVRRMMAKRPERRFKDYDELIEAIDLLGHDPSLELPAPELLPLAARVDDGDEPGEIGLVPLESRESGRVLEPSPPRPAPTTLLDERTSPTSVRSSPRPSGSVPTRPPSGGSKPPVVDPPSRSHKAYQPEREAVPDGVDLAALAEVDRDHSPVPRARSRSTSARPVADLPEDANFLEEVFESDSPAMAMPRKAASGSSDDDWKAVRGWVFGALGASVLVVLLLIGLRAAFAPPKETNPGNESGDGSVTGTNTGGGIVDPRRSGPPPPSVAGPGPALIPLGPGPSAGTTWVEPIESTKTPRAETAYPPEWEKRFPVAARSAAAKPNLAVRRIGQAGAGMDTVASLRAALDDRTAVIELADNGPFFEADLRVTGKNRIVRARPGYRPIVMVEAPNTDFLKAQPSTFVISGGSLTLEGIDLVVKVSFLTSKQTALFLLRNGDLTLRDCTVTVVGPNPRPYVVFGVDEPEGIQADRSSTVRLERTLVRGAASALFRLVGAATEIVLDRSVLLCGNGPIVSASGGTTPGAAQARKIALYRCVTASTGPLLELAVSRIGGGDAPVELRALGSTIARLEGGTIPSPLALREDTTTEPRGLIAVQASYSSFVGWSSWLVAGPNRILKVPDFAGARAAWPGLEDVSPEPMVWKPPTSTERIEPEDLREWAPWTGPILDRVASPAPLLHEKTVEPFQRAAIPELALGDPATSSSGFFPEPAPAPKPGLLELQFDAQAMPWQGDLGRFLRAAIGRDTRLIRVRAFGSGTKEMSPVRLPNGVSLEILVYPPPLSSGKVEPLTWTPKAGTQGEALIDIRDADLVLSRFRLTRKGAAGPDHLLRVEDGHLVITQGALTSSESGSGNLILFRAALSRELPNRGLSSLPKVDRPVCRLVDCLLTSSGDLIAADLARGVVSLTHCVLATEGTAFTLRPEKVRRDRFEADLWLERCTVLADRSIVGFGHWSGAAPGPDRPWLIWTKNSAFLDLFERGIAPRQGAMLRLTNPDALARGAVAWQATGDAYDISQYILAGSVQTGTTRADLKSRWINLWGAEHVFGVVGATPGVSKPVVRLPVDRVKPGDYVPGDLAVLEPAQVGADLQRLGITPTDPKTPPKRR